MKNKINLRQLVKKLVGEKPKLATDWKLEMRRIIISEYKVESGETYVVFSLPTLEKFIEDLTK